MRLNDSRRMNENTFIKLQYVQVHSRCNLQPVKHYSNCSCHVSQKLFQKCAHKIHLITLSIAVAALMIFFPFQQLLLFTQDEGLQRVKGAQRDARGPYSEPLSILSNARSGMESLPSRSAFIPSPFTADKQTVERCYCSASGLSPRSLRALTCIDYLRSLVVRFVFSLCILCLAPCFLARNRKLVCGFLVAALMGFRW